MRNWGKTWVAKIEAENIESFRDWGEKNETVPEIGINDVQASLPTDELAILTKWKTKRIGFVMGYENIKYSDILIFNMQLSWQDY